MLLKVLGFVFGIFVTGCLLAIGGIITCIPGIIALALSVWFLVA